MAYTREQLLQAAEKAEKAGDTAASQRLFKTAESLNKAVVEEEETEKPKYSVDQLKAAIARAEEAGDEGAVQRLSKAVAGMQNYEEDDNITFMDSVVNALKVGSSQSAGLIAGITNALKAEGASLSTPIGTFASIVQANVTGEGVLPKFLKAQDYVEGKVKDLTGADPTMPTREGAGFEEKLLLSGIREAADVTNYTGAGIFKAGLKLKGAGLKLLGRASSSLGFGVTGQLGATVGADIEENLFGTQTGIGATLFGLKFAGGQALATPLIRRGGGASIDLYKQLRTKYKNVKSNPDQVAKDYATGASKRLLEIAAEGVSADTIEKTIDDFARISKSIGVGDFPLLVSLSDNPALRSQAVRLAKSDGTFRSKVNEEVKRVSEAIDKHAYDLFGARYAIAKVDASPQILKEQIKRQENIVAVDDQLDKLSTGLKPNETRAQTGNAITNLVEARKQIAKAELSVNYKQLMLEAKKKGAQLPKEATKDLYNFVIENNFRDIFGKGTPLDKRILSVFGPKTLKSGKRVFTPVNFNHVDSLKRAINGIKRRPNLPDDIAFKINQLDDAFKRAKNQIPGNWNQRLNDLDRLYYEKVGVPFNAQGIKDMSSKKYAEQVAPILLDKKSSLDDFLNIAGEEGVVIAKNAMYSKIYKEAFNENGLIDRKKLLTFSKKNREVIDSIPGMSDEVVAILADERVLQLRRQALDNAYKIQERRFADNVILKDGEGAIDFKRKVKGMINNTDNIDTFFDSLSDLSPQGKEAVLNAARAEFVDIGRSSGTSMYNFVTDPSNSTLVNKMFGDKYVSNLRDIAQLQDAIRGADVSTMSAVIAKEEIDFLNRLLPGLDVPYVTSQLRDRISSFTQKMVRIASKFQTAKGREAVDLAISDLLIDPQGIQKLRNTAVQFDFKLNKPEAFKNIQGAFADIMPLYMYTSLKAGQREQEEQ